MSVEVIVPPRIDMVARFEFISGDLIGEERHHCWLLKNEALFLR